MKRKFKTRNWFGVATGVLIGLFTGFILSSGKPEVRAASSDSQAEHRQMNPEQKMDLLIDGSGDKVVSRILKVERQVNSLTKKLAAHEDISAKTKDLQYLGRRLAQAEAKWRREMDKLKRRLSENEKALEKLCARQQQAGRIRRPGIPTTLLGSACDGYEPAR